MDIKSTLIKNRSTQGGNHSTTGSDESIKHSDGPDHTFTSHKVAGQPAQNVGKAKVEWKYDHIGEKGAPKGITSHNGPTFIHTKARDERLAKHPNKVDDPLACKC